MNLAFRCRHSNYPNPIVLGCQAELGLWHDYHFNPRLKFVADTSQVGDGKGHGGVAVNFLMGKNVPMGLPIY